MDLYFFKSYAMTLVTACQCEGSISKIKSLLYLTNTDKVKLNQKSP